MAEIIPQPSQDTFSAWTADFCGAYPDDFFFPASPMEPWGDWAMRLYTSPSFDGILIPQPYGFTQWQDWVSALIMATT